MANHKPEKDRAAKALLLRCKKSDKDEWRKAARPNLSQWVVNTLNRAAARELAQRRKLTGN